MSEYDEQAEEFLKKTNSKLEIVFVEYGIFDSFDDNNYRDIYRFTLSRKGCKKKLTDRFGQSLHHSQGGEEPQKLRAYDVLSCLDGHEPGEYADWRAEFGYNDCKLSEYPKIWKIYDAVCRQYKILTSMYNEEELEMLNEIQ